MRHYLEDNYTPIKEQEEEFGCGFCWDKKRCKDKELFFLDKANNMRVCSFCPNCGRKFKGVNRYV